jgi:cation diffusion facilitator CzcD-associated flavoprotein CzcO
VKLSVDGQPVNAHDTLNYKGMMFSDVPNLVGTFGYINASWTLKADLTAEYTCRVLNHMDRVSAKQCTPRRVDPTVTPESLSDFAPGYIQRALASLPQQGSKMPWKLFQNYLLDVFLLRMGKVDDGTLQFG